MPFCNCPTGRIYILHNLLGPIVQDDRNSNVARAAAWKRVATCLCMLPPEVFDIPGKALAARGTFRKEVEDERDNREEHEAQCSLRRKRRANVVRAESAGALAA